MPRNRALPFLICTVFFAVLTLADDNVVRKKRQAPNVNVHVIPKTSFSCADRTAGEYYADPETECQVYHICVPGMYNKMSVISFVCPNGTIFSQATRVCTPYERVYCTIAGQFYDSVNGEANSGGRTDYENENNDNYVPQPAPREPPQAPRQSSRGRQSAATAPPPPPPTQTQRSRFRSGASQFRGQQGAPATTAAPARQTTTLPPARAAPARPAPPAFRPPAIPVRPGIGGIANAVPPRPTPRATVSTSTTSYEYDYEYEYEDEELPAANQGNARSKREAVEDYDLENFEENFEKTGFTCNDKVAGGVYADIESDCEMFHICVPLGKYKMLDYKVFCANGTAFDQETGSCKEKKEFSCENARLYYQYEKPNQPASSKKPVLKKKKPSKSKKVRSVRNE